MTETFLDLTIDQIVPNPKLERDLDQREFDELKRSIDEVGLLHPIVVTKTPEGYLHLAGGRRLLAMQALGWTTFPAQCIDATEEDVQDLATVDENLCRSDRGFDRAILLQRRAEIHKRLFGEGGKPPTKGPMGPRSEPLRKKTGSEKRLERLANDFSEPELRNLKIAGVTVHEAVEISKATKDNPDARRKILNSVTFGQPVAQAIAEVLHPDETSVISIGSQKVVVDRHGGHTDDPGLSVEEWIEQLEGPRPALIKANNHACFDNDAKLYRRVRAKLAELKKEIGPLVARARALGLGGAFNAKLHSLLTTQHVEDWIACPECNGAGKEAEDRYCAKCHGDGYVVTHSRG